MHELTLAVALAELAEQEALRCGASHVSRLHVRAGVFRQVSPDLLKDAFAQVRRGALADAELDITVVMPAVYCLHCGAGEAFSSFTAHCRICGSADVEVRGGDELELTGMDVAEADDRQACVTGGGCGNDRTY
ncbi:MAG: hydrogenase maturation nickel metallochaperone HypA [Phycisphaerae bacterium]|nr:MAG: hydrogenase maturation nickel metallochaperone HypA [Planctomycetota bacterium]KAB2949143.1 MAG: hydrogenase maturation nickel metallochaperone HypA [Phycisphaerae bacterium]MBE7456312.1 hydrogenase maturation nickel metallochaperone HypA [Planctomycetia bacterium]MCK6465642.1 hydrogenase maturation nickel metallochaperone HypA [Phycisphaerae bacterium]MCL4718431.1 hydrogenase maturation nickel metallochaperone HypA [Phycisphaerae bacterium]